MFCKWKNALGEPKKGIHSYRIFNIAIADVLLTLLAAGLIAWFFHQNFFLILFFLFILGIVLHYLFCVKTTVHLFLFGNK